MSLSRLGHYKREIGLFLAPLVSAVIYLTPMDLSREAHIVFAIMGFCLVFWLTEVIPLSMTALLGVTIAVVLGVVNVKEAFLSLGHPVILLFIGSFLIAQAMTKHGLDRRFALNLLSLDFFLKSPIRLIAGFSLISFVLSMWVSNTATTAMLLPLVLGIIQMFKRKNVKDTGKFALFTLLAVAYSASIGGATTLIGTPTNLIGAGFLKEEGYDVDFLRWFLLAAPITITSYVALLLYIRFHIRNFSFDRKKIKELIKQEKKSLPKVSLGEKNTVFVFSLAAFLWILPGLANILGNKELYQVLKAHIPEAVVALIAAVLLFLLPARKGEGTLTAKDLKELDWDTILLFGGGIALGKLIIKTGLAAYIGKNVAGLISPDMVVLFIFVLVLSMIFLTEISSNTATVITFAPILIGILKEMGVDLFYPVFGIIIAASFAFMLPVATPPNAIIYGSRHIPLGKMVRVGFFMNIIGSIIITFFIVLYMG
ncbi:MAG: DASS family sodium-coupled anion symporter [Aquificae bacterium]|nr:DASS family sodium-coupled anion symporter [Aquificota bacterium]